MKAREILTLPYGSGQQVQAADRWYKHFADLEERCPSLVPDKLWYKLHGTDVFYLARRRYLD